MTDQEVIQEYTKCYLDAPYYGEKYCQVFDLTRGGTYPLKVFPKQKQLLDHYKKNRFSLVLKPRQAGVSTVTAFHCAHLIMFAPKQKKQLILIIANMQETAFEFLAKIVSFIDTAPDWLLEKDKDGKVKYLKKNAGEIVLPNGSGAKAKATSKDALRGYAPTLLILDEAAFIEHSEALWMAALPVLSTGGGAILLSTPNGYDPLYYALYNGAIKKENDFKIFEMNWYQDPRFNKDLRWVKKTTVGDEIIEEVHVCKRNEDDSNWDFEEFPKLVADGYKPTSTWFEGMCRQYNNDPRKIAQELECDFLGSGDNVVDEEYIKNQETFFCKDALRFEYLDRNFWIWEDPKRGHQYMMGVDVSRGDSADYSTISIWDMETMELVAEYQGKIPPDVLGVVADKYGRIYGDALAVVDITGGMGQSTVIKMMELKYPNMHYSEGAGAAIIKSQLLRYKKQNNMIPGLMIGANRTNIVSTFEIAIRCGQIKIRSKRLIQELRTFIYKNGRPDHQTGFHDDLIFSSAMVMFVFQHAFKNLKRYKAQTVAMLNAWNVVDTVRPSLHNSPIDKNITDEFAWLFK